MNQSPIIPPRGLSARHGSSKPSRTFVQQNSAVVLAEISLSNRMCVFQNIPLSQIVHTYYIHAYADFQIMLFCVSFVLVAPYHICRPRLIHLRDKKPGW